MSVTHATTTIKKTSFSTGCLLTEEKGLKNLINDNKNILLLGQKFALSIPQTTSIPKVPSIG